MPEGEMGFEGEGGSGGGGGGGKGGGGGPIGPGQGEALALPESSLDELPGGSCAEVIRFVQEQWRAERQRADDAQRALAEARAGAAETEAALRESRAALDAAERRHAIDLRLIEEETVDIESARLLTELAVSRMSDADVGAAIADLKRRKPFLFRGGRSPGHRGAAVAPGAAPSDPIEAIAEEALRTGDRNALLRYLRARRSA